MKGRCLVVLCGLVVTAASVLAAAGQSPGDPISGAWGQGKTTLLQLAFDGKREVSGTIFVVNPGGSIPAPIQTGTFEPASGALSLGGEIKGPEGRVMPYLIEGALKDGTLALNYAFGDEKGSISVTRLTDPGPGAAAAPAASGDSIVTLRKHFAEVSGLVLEAADLVPADKYGYRPAPTVRTFGELVGHIADSYGVYCGRAGATQTGSSDPTGKGAFRKETLVSRLKDATRACTAPSSAADTEALIGSIGHTNLHYGNMITYMRMLGLVPPSS